MRMTADGRIYPVEDKVNLNKRRLRMNLAELSQAKFDTV